MKLTPKVLSARLLFFTSCKNVNVVMLVVILASTYCNVVEGRNFVLHFRLIYLNYERRLTGILHNWKGLLLHLKLEAFIGKWWIR